MVVSILQQENEIETCPLEDYLVFQSQTQPIFALIHGGVQKGKSTLFYTLANNISLLKSDYKEEWDYEKYCARSLDELMEMVRKYDGKVLGYEEAQREISTSTWYDKFAMLFALLMETQGYKKNLIFMVQPCGLTIPNRHRRMINIGIEVLKKNERKKSVFFRNTVYDFQNWRLEESFIWYNHLLGFTRMTYTDEQLRKAKEYTNWLIKAKEIILENLIERSKALNSLNFNTTPDPEKYKLKEERAIKFKEQQPKPLF